jgi:putative membrane protein
MKTTLLLGAILAAALALGSQSFAQDKASQTFIKQAIEGNRAMVEMGQLAQKNGKSEGVRSFGQMLEHDHKDALQKSTTAANSMGVTPPTAPNSKQKSMYDRISKLSGEKFDDAFVSDMIAGHKKDVSEYEKEAKQNNAVGTYAKEELPVMQKHLQTAESLNRAQTTGKR